MSDVLFADLPILWTGLKLGIALLFALPIAWDRERNTRIVGLRTLPLVAVGSCAYVLVAQTFLTIEDTGANARIMQGLLSGIGFLGGGAILKHKDHVMGTASAASIWILGAMGAAVAYGRYDLAFLLALIDFAVLHVLGRLKRHVPTHDENGLREESDED